MKTIHKILGLLLVLVVAAVGCSKDYDMPPLNKPVYTGPEENINIKELKEKFSSVSEGTPQLIEFEYILKARIISSDISGNIFKQVYIEDHTGGINLGADQNNISTDYALGQEVYINLHGLYMVSYGGQLQIGFKDTQANRIPWNIFTKHVVKNNWPDAKAIEITSFDDFANFGEKNVNTLVKLDKIYFVDGGKLPYSEDQKTENRTIKDSKGNSVILRTSGYSNFYKEILPFGTGSIIGILSKHRDDWQLTIRSLEDVLTFDGVAPGDTDPEKPIIPEGDLLFKENFGPKFAKGDAPWPLVAAYTGYEDKNVTYSDPSGTADIRNTKDSENHVWFKANTDAEFVVAGLPNAQGKTLSLTYAVAANVYNETDMANLKDIEVWYNGKQLPTQSKEVKGKADLNKFYTFTIDNIAGVDGAELKFVVKGATNAFGFRLNNLALAANGGGSEQPTDPEEPTTPVGDVVLKETFGAKFDQGDVAWPKVAAFTGYDDKSVVYTDPTGVADIRNTKTLDNHVWLKAGADSEFVVSGLVGVAGKELNLSYGVAANVFNESDATNLNSLEVWYNGKQLATESKEVKGKADLNKFYTLSIKGIQGVEGAELKFVAKGVNNKFGLRLDNLEVSVK